MENAGFIGDHAASGAIVYTDEATVYCGMPFVHASIRHLAGQYVDGPVHTNGIESFWSMLKRAHKGTFHKMSPKHLSRYVAEFAGRHNVRGSDTIEQMTSVVSGLVGKALMYDALIADNGMDSGARATD